MSDFKVELHLHLDGSLRSETVWDFAKRKGVRIGNGSLQDVQEAIRVYCPQNLKYFLDKFSYFIPLIGGDVSAIERVAYELAEDQAREGVAYFEARYSPIFMADPKGYYANCEDKNTLKYQEVINAVTRGLRRGENDFNIKISQILCIITGFDAAKNLEVLELIKANRDKIVAIDVAGNEKTTDERHSPEEVAIFQAAKAAGIRRTAHAAESGPAWNVKLAIEELCAERIGHGYHVVEDENIYADALANQVHFECCPHSSILTGAVCSQYNKGKHPIVQFAEDGANFSINKDDTTVTGTTLFDEYELLHKIGLTEAHIVRANFNAARASFLPDAEKAELLKHLRKVYGI